MTCAIRPIPTPERRVSEPISPAEAIAFALRVSFCLPVKRLGPDSRTVKLILQALELTDWKIVRR